MGFSVFKSFCCAPNFLSLVLRGHCFDSLGLKLNDARMLFVILHSLKSWKLYLRLLFPFCRNIINSKRYHGIIRGAHTTVYFVGVIDAKH